MDADKIQKYSTASLIKQKSWPVCYLLGPVCAPAETQYSYNGSLSLPSQASSHLSLVSLDYASNLSPSLSNAVLTHLCQ